MNTDNESYFDCPISMTKFVLPKVLPCGHTFDVESLKKLQRTNKFIECPLCKTKLLTKVIDLPNNWLIISMMNIKIKTPITNEAFSKNKALILSSSCLEPIINAEYNIITKEIEQAAMLGLYEYSYSTARFKNYKLHIQPLVQDNIVNRLKQYGFNVQTKKMTFLKATNTLISWSNI